MFCFEDFERRTQEKGMFWCPGLPALINLRGELKRDERVNRSDANYYWLTERVTMIK